MASIRGVVAAVAATMVIAVGSVPASATPSGLDVSWPQCPAVALGPAGGFTIVGLTNGRAYTDNPCLATEWTWASSTGAPTGLYLVINSAPDAGAAAAYAWGAGAVDHALATMAAKRISAPFVWLDVETGKFWSGDKPANAAVVRGAIDRLHARGFGSGIYSTSY